MKEYHCRNWFRTPETDIYEVTVTTTSLTEYMMMMMMMVVVLVIVVMMMMIIIIISMMRFQQCNFSTGGRHCSLLNMASQFSFPRLFDK